MARPPIEDVVTDKVQKYLREALEHGAEPRQLSTLAVANAIGHDRRVLKKYGLDVVIANAAKRQSKAAKSGNSAKRRSLEDRIAASQASNEQLATQANALLAQLALVEGNAKRLGINPEELYRPLVPPDRRLPNIFGNKGRSDKTRR